MLLFCNISGAIGPSLCGSRNRLGLATIDLLFGFSTPIGLPAAKASPASRLVSVVELGELRPAKTTNHEFFWTNNTGRLLRLTSVSPSCDCVAIKSFTEKIPAGEIVGNTATTTTLRIFGKPGAAYVIEARTQLRDDVAWVPAVTITLTNAVQTFDWPNSVPAPRFFRAVENASITPTFLATEGAKDNLVKLRLQGLSGGVYLIEGSTNVAAPLHWTPVQRVVLTNASQPFAITNFPGAVRVFRAKVD